MTLDKNALEVFTEYFVRNYPGPDTIIHDPKWHAPRIFRAAISAHLSALPGENKELIARARDWDCWGNPLVGELIAAVEAADAKVAEAARKVEGWKEVYDRQSKLREQDVKEIIELRSRADRLAAEVERMRAVLARFKCTCGRFCRESIHDCDRKAATIALSAPALRGDDEARAIIKAFMACPELSDCDPRDKDAETLALESRALRFLNRAAPAPGGERNVSEAGWKLVPLEPTWEMQIAGRDAILAGDDSLDLSTDDARAAYIAMLNAAPAKGGE